MVLVALLAACGPGRSLTDGGDGGPLADAGDAGQLLDAGDGGDAGFVQAPHAAFPQVPYGGGPVIARPQLVTVTFPGLAITRDAQDYDAWLAGSGYLAQVGADYGVSGGPAPLNADLDGGPPAWSGPADIAAWLAAQFGGTIPAPTPDGGEIYVLYLPPSAPLAGICNTVLGFHDDGLAAGVPFAYAVVPDCPESVTGYPDPENFELVASHEVVEAATNPYFDVGGTLAWQLTSPSDPWFAPNFGEVADLCEGQIWQDQDGGTWAQRIWSNTRARLGTGSPCLPAPAAPYFNVSPSPDAPVAIPAGGTQTIEVTGWSTAPVEPWDLTEMAWFGDFDPAPVFADAGIANGVTQQVVLSVPAGTPPGSRSQVWIGSYAPTASDYTSFWPVAVTSQ